MARPDLTHILVDDATGTVLEMGSVPFKAKDGQTAYADVDASDYDAGPVRFDAKANKLLMRLDDVAIGDWFDGGYRTQAKDLVDAECRRRILSDTFEYPYGSGKLFSMSEYAQINWTGTAALIASGAVDLSEAAITVRTKDDKAEHEFDSNEAALEACAAYFARVQMHRQALQAAKTAIAASKTKDEVDAVVAAYLGS